MSLTLARPALIAVACSLMPFALVADELAESCASCHKDALSLESSDAAELAELIRDIRDGEVPHVVPIPPLTDDEIAELAKALAGT